MQSNKFTIEECGIQNHESKEMIIKMINNQINTYKLEYLSQWERDHSITPDSINKKIEALRAKKKEIEGFFSETNHVNPTIDLSVSFELKVLDQTPESVFA